MFRRNLITTIAAVALAAAVPVSGAADYPSKPIRFIVVAAPGDGTPEQLYEQIRREIEQWRQVVSRAEIRIN